jgi:hypothetical protein
MDLASNPPAGILSYSEMPIPQRRSKHTKTPFILLYELHNQSTIERDGLVERRALKERVQQISCETSVTCYFFYFGFIHLIFLNIK